MYNDAQLPVAGLNLDGDLEHHKRWFKGIIDTCGKHFIVLVFPQKDMEKFVLGWL